MIIYNNFNLKLKVYNHFVVKNVHSVATGSGKCLGGSGGKKALEIVVLCSNSTALEDDRI